MRQPQWSDRELQTTFLDETFLKRITNLSIFFWADSFYSFKGAAERLYAVVADKFCYLADGMFIFFEKLACLIDPYSFHIIAKIYAALLLEDGGDISLRYVKFLADAAETKTGVHIIFLYILLDSLYQPAVLHGFILLDLPANFRTDAPQAAEIFIRAVIIADCLLIEP